MEQHFVVDTPDDVSALFAAIDSLRGKHNVFAFRGDLGAGKTTLIKALCKKFGVKDEMSSPSFAIVNEYDSEEVGQIYHFDLYRLKTPEELLDIGWEDYLYTDSMLFVEWPDKGGTFLPDDTVYIDIKVDEESESRNLTLST